MSPLINTASKVYQGSTLATKVYQGAAQVWPPAAAFGPNQSVYTSQTPATSTNTSNLCVAAAVTCLVAGRITGLRYYRHPSTTDSTRSLRLWHAGGTELGAASTSGDTGSGWKTATLATPVAVTAGQSIRVAMYLLTPNKILGYSNPLATPITNGDVSLTTHYSQADTVGTSFPATTNTWGFFVDVVFQKAL